MWLLLGLLSILSFFLAPVLVLLALPFAKQDKTNIFPSWLQWLNTPDDPGCQQGLYEQQVIAVYDWGGFYWKTLYWLGWRNQMYGLFASLCAKYDGSPISVWQWW